MRSTGNADELRRGLLHEGAEHFENLAGGLGAPGNRTGHHLRTHGVELVLEVGHDAEVTAAAAKAPEQIAIFLFARAHDAPVGGDHLHGETLSLVQPNRRVR